MTGRKTIQAKQQEAQQAEKTKETTLPAKARRPAMLTGVTYNVDSPNGKIFLTINHDEKGNVFEVFLSSGKHGSDMMALADSLGRMISFALRLQSSIPNRERIERIVSELRGLGGSRSVGFGRDAVRSFPDAVARVLEKHCGVMKEKEQ